MRYAISANAKSLEKTVLEISEREQRRIGQDLHDGLGQHLTGIAFMTKVQEQKLADRRNTEAVDAAKIVKLVNDAILKTRELSRGLLPVVSDTHGLCRPCRCGLAKLKIYSESIVTFNVTSRFLFTDTPMATHLFHIAQEAVNNAIKHGRAQTF